MLRPPLLEASHNLPNLRMHTRGHMQGSASQHQREQALIRACKTLPRPAEMSQCWKRSHIDRHVSEILRSSVYSHPAVTPPYYGYTIRNITLWYKVRDAGAIFALARLFFTSSIPCALPLTFLYLPSTEMANKVKKRGEKREREESEHDDSDESASGDRQRPLPRSLEALQLSSQQTVCHLFCSIALVSLSWFWF